ncbi:hypothetical protein LINGRAHAP2_LOCUS19922 [Linum grandiflorum]
MRIRISTRISVPSSPIVVGGRFACELIRCRFLEQRRSWPSGTSQSEMRFLIAMGGRFACERIRCRFLGQGQGWRRGTSQSEMWFSIAMA